MLEVFLHVSILAALAAGWGYWIWRATGRRAATRGHWWWWCACAGFAAQALTAQLLYYAGLSIVAATVVVAAVAVAGLGFFAVRMRGTVALARRRGARQAGAVAAAAALVFVAQGAGLLLSGPGDYFGRAKIDQYNYVAVAQALIEAPRDLELHEVGPRPWLVRTISGRRERITQSVVHAEVAVLARSDASRTYGAVSVGFVAVLAGCAVALLRAWGVRPRRAVAAGLIAGLLPAATEVHLECYFSQAATLWVPLAVAGVLARRAVRGVGAVLAGVIAGFHVGAYPELVFLAGAAGIVALGATNPPRDWVRRGLQFGLTALLVNLGYLPDLVAFFTMQLAAGSDWAPAALTPDGAGWTALGVGFVGREWWPRIVPLAAGVAVSAAAVGTIGWAGPRLRWRLAALWLAPAVFLALLLAGPQPQVYGVMKVMRSAAPLLWVVLVAGGATRGPVARALVWAACGIVGAAGLLEVARANRELASGPGAAVSARLPVFATAEWRELADAPAGRTVVVDEPRNLRAAWLCYRLRHHRVFLARQNVADRLLAAEWYECRRWPQGLQDAWIVSAAAARHRAFVPPPVDYDVVGLEPRRHGAGRAWQGPGELVVRLRQPDPSARETRGWLCFAIRSDAPRLRLKVGDTPGRVVFEPSLRWALPCRWEGPELLLRFSAEDAGRQIEFIPVGFEPPDDDVARPPIGFVPMR